MTVIPKSALKVALLTGMRPSEVIGLKWAQVDLDARKVWFGLSKTTDYREIALSSWTVAQLERLARYSGKREYVFQGPTGGCLQKIPNVTRGKDTWTPTAPSGAGPGLINVDVFGRSYPALLFIIIA